MNRLFQKIIVAVLAMTWSIIYVQAQQSVNMDRYITLTVKKGANISLDIWADAVGTPIRIVSGNTDETLTAGATWTGSRTYTASDGTMKIYGNVQQLECSGNKANLTELDASNNTKLQGLTCNNNALTKLNLGDNTELTRLNCLSNSLTSLDVSKNTKLESLYCQENSLTSLNVGKNTNLTILNCRKNRLTSLNISGCEKLKNLECFDNSLTSLDVSQNINLQRLLCHNNSLTSLDVSQNTELTYLNCRENKLTALDVSKNINLNTLFCYQNSFTTAAFDDFFCSLPNRTEQKAGKVNPIFNSSSSEKDIIIAANIKNATDKNWKVQYYEGNANITGFTGTHTCGSGNSVNMERYITLTVKEGELIQLDFVADVAGTQIKIVSGDKEETVTVGTDWYGLQSYEAGAGTMTVYGDVQQFDCDENEDKLTALDISHNTKLQDLLCSNNTITSLDISKNTELKYLACFGNKFTTAVIDDLYCSLPDRKNKPSGRILPLFDDSSAEKANVLATNDKNAAARNWKVQYQQNDTDIAGFTGTHSCTSGIDEVENIPTLAVYPNPVKDILHVTSDKPVHSIRIYNVYGAEVLHATDVTSINVSHLPAGVYMVRADGWVTRIIKE